MVYIFSKKSAALKTKFPKTAIIVSSPLAKHSPSYSDITYIDICGLTAAELKKTITQAKKSCKDSSWGIIDPKGTVKDPASLFFEGASDYLGPGLLKASKSIDSKRFTGVLQWKRSLAAAAGSQEASKLNEAAEGFIKSGIKLPAANAFPGWKKIQSGKAMPFYLLYCSLQGKTALETRLQEKALTQVYKRFHSILVSNFKEGDALLWMETGKDCLFLLPPKSQCVSSIINACISLIVSAPQIVLETLGLSIPANFIFALHYGSISYKPPGKTGTVVSDAVNSIFHLGAKKAQYGRLTITAGLPDVTIPKVMQDLFVPCGEYEGRKIWHTKKFNYAKSWL
ncbi:MAG: hypothetical protein FWD22_06100 [Treponema sp.]|nr:hypothetical protein [Treponema sp.]